MELAYCLRISAGMCFALSAFYWFRASRVNLWISGAIGGPYFPSMEIEEKFTALFYSSKKIASKKCFALAGWLNFIAALFACMGSICTAIELWIS